MLELVAGIVVAMIALWAVLEPLLRSSANLETPAPDLDDDDLMMDLEESGSAKVQALLALREIEFDRATGKLSDADYTSLKQKYSRSALAAIRDEKAEEGQADRSGETAPDAEAVIAEAKSRRSGECPTCQYAVEPGSVFCSNCGRSLTQADASPRCWVCGADRPANAKFCGECGATLSDPSPAAQSSIDA